MSTPGKPLRRIPSPFARRLLSVVGEPERELVIVVGKPQRDPVPPGDWRCPYIVEGLIEERRFAHGIDSLQALQMAIEAARAAILEAGLVCSYSHSEPGDIGIPRSVPTFGGAGRDFAPRVERYIDQELAKLAALTGAGPIP